MRARSRSRVATFAAIAIAALSCADGARAQDGAAAWATISRVLTSPRCINCHPRDASPTQGDDMHRHRPPVLRGPEDSGVAAMRCATCHTDRNQDLAGVPGAPHWHAAPAAMGWAGLGGGALCRTIKDVSRNGNRSPAALRAHMTDDALVRWAWRPGARRTPPPVPFEQFAAALEAWVTAGAPCPD
jgi:hypothetical protein